MKIISLGKSVDCSKKIIDGEINTPNCFNVYRSGSSVFSYKCGNSPQIPADHIGLSYLVYSHAIDCLSVSKINEDGSVTKNFEQIENLPYINVTSFMDNVNKDTLRWYGDLEGNAIRLSEYGTKIIRTNYKSSNEVIDRHPETGENYREIAFRGGFCAALKEYVDYAESSSNGLSIQDQENLIEFVSNQIDSFEENLEKLKMQDVEATDLNIPSEVQ